MPITKSRLHDGLGYGMRKTGARSLDSLPGHKKANVREYVASTKGRLSLHFLPGYAPDLNPDEMIWSHVKRTCAARRPLSAPIEF